MSRYSEEGRQDGFAMIRETLPRADATVNEPPLQDHVERWKREANKQEEKFARERAARARSMQLGRTSTAAIYEQRIAKVEAQLLRVIRAMGKVADGVEAELRELTQENIEARQAYLETKLAETLVQLSQLSETVAADCKSILHPPALLPTGCERSDDDGR